MAQCSGKITFYEGKHFTGRKLEVYGDCDNFQDRGFMNRVNSIRVESGAWVCYDHPDFRGQQFILEHGNYPDFLCWNGHNDHMGSCRPVGMHGENFRMEIFEGCNFTGQCLEFQDDCPFLQSRGWAKNCVNAVKVYGDGAQAAGRLPPWLQKAVVRRHGAPEGTPELELSYRAGRPLPHSPSGELDVMAAHFQWTGCGHGGSAQGVSALLLESGQDPRAGLASASPPYSQLLL
ncbi:gamma-crystallin N [Puma concolor]|uniref:Gamma-crystallin N n=1 Tax=Puma concolor TaxID=9696 RepID=A0A6P6IAK8_PUMCO|nr:gamma-crystallin N [Puma concolor]